MNKINKRESLPGFIPVEPEIFDKDLGLATCSGCEYVHHGFGCAPRISCSKDDRKDGCDVIYKRVVMTGLDR